MFVIWFRFLKSCLESSSFPLHCNNKTRKIYLLQPFTFGGNCAKFCLGLLYFCCAVLVSYGDDDDDFVVFVLVGMKWRISSHIRLRRSRYIIWYMCIVYTVYKPIVSIIILSVWNVLVLKFIQMKLEYNNCKQIVFGLESIDLTRHYRRGIFCRFGGKVQGV